MLKVSTNTDIFPKFEDIFQSLDKLNLLVPSNIVSIWVTGVWLNNNEIDISLFILS